MKLTWKKKNQNNKRPLSTTLSIPSSKNLPFEPGNEDEDHNNSKNKEEPSKADDYTVTSTGNLTNSSDVHDETTQLAESFQAQGNKLAEAGKYREALGKWEAALTLQPDRASLHEQKAQVLLEIGESWNSLKAATRATELEPSWAEAWITLGRAQLNFGEPDSAMENFDRALAIKPDSVDALDDRETAVHLVKKRKQLHSSGLSAAENRYVVGEKAPEAI